MKKLSMGAVTSVVMVLVLSGCGEKLAAGNSVQTREHNIDTQSVKQLSLADFAGTYELKDFTVSDKDNNLLLTSSSIIGWSGSSTIDPAGRISQILNVPPSTVIYSTATMSLKDPQTIHFINDSGSESDVQFTFINNTFTTTMVNSLGTEKDTWVRTSTSVVAKELNSSSLSKIMGAGSLATSSIGN